MHAVLFAPLMMVIVLCLALDLRRQRGGVGTDEEFAHATALERRLVVSGDGAERRREIRQAVGRPCAASVLGRPETRLEGRILDLSRSGMRIAVTGSFPARADINVEWGANCFV